MAPLSPMELEAKPATAGKPHRCDSAVLDIKPDDADSGGDTFDNVASERGADERDGSSAGGDACGWRRVWRRDAGSGTRRCCGASVLAARALKAFVLLVLMLAIIVTALVFDAGAQLSIKANHAAAPRGAPAEAEKVARAPLAAPRRPQERRE